MKKPDQSKVEYTVAEKRKGTKNQTVAEAMNVTVRYVQKLWARFKHVPEGKIVFPARMGRPPRGLPPGPSGRPCLPPAAPSSPARA